MTEERGPAQPGAPFRDAPSLPSAKALADAALVEHDLQFVVDCCERVLADERAGCSDALVERALWRSALVAYVRCFSTDQRGALSLADVAALPPEGAVEFHEHVRQMRNKHVAHRGPLHWSRQPHAFPPRASSSSRPLPFLESAKSALVATSTAMPARSSCVHLPGRSAGAVRRVAGQRQERTAAARHFRAMGAWV